MFTKDEYDNLQRLANNLKALLDNRLEDNQAWKIKLRLTIATISDYNLPIKD